MNEINNNQNVTNSLAADLAILFPIFRDVSNLEYLKVIGSVIGAKNIHSIYRSDGLVKIYLKSKTCLSQIINSDVNIKGCKPFVSDARVISTVILSNVDPTIPDRFLENLLQSYGVLKSPIGRQKLSSIDDFSHIISGDVRVSIEIFSGHKIPKSLKFVFNGVNHEIITKTEIQKTKESRVTNKVPKYLNTASTINNPVKRTTRSVYEFTIDNAETNIADISSPKRTKKCYASTKILYNNSVTNSCSSPNKNISKAICTYSYKSMRKNLSVKTPELLTSFSNISVNNCIGDKDDIVAFNADELLKEQSCTDLQMCYTPKISFPFIVESICSKINSDTNSEVKFWNTEEDNLNEFILHIEDSCVNLKKSKDCFKTTQNKNSSSLNVLQNVDSVIFNADQNLVKAGKVAIASKVSRYKKDKIKHANRHSSKTQANNPQNKSDMVNKSDLQSSIKISNGQIQQSSGKKPAQNSSKSLKKQELVLPIGQNKIILRDRSIKKYDLTSPKTKIKYKIPYKTNKTSYIVDKVPKKDNLVEDLSNHEKINKVMTKNSNLKRKNSLNSTKFQSKRLKSQNSKSVACLEVSLKNNNSKLTRSSTLKRNSTLITEDTVSTSKEKITLSETQFQHIENLSNKRQKLHSQDSNKSLKMSIIGEKTIKSNKNACSSQTKTLSSDINKNTTLQKINNGKKRKVETNPDSIHIKEHISVANTKDPKTNLEKIKIKKSKILQKSESDHRDTFNKKLRVPVSNDCTSELPEDNFLEETTNKPQQSKVVNAKQSSIDFKINNLEHSLNNETEINDKDKMDINNIEDSLIISTEKDKILLVEEKNDLCQIKTNVIIEDETSREVEANSESIEQNHACYSPTDKYKLKKQENNKKSDTQISSKLNLENIKSSKSLSSIESKQTEEDTQFSLCNNSIDKIINESNEGIVNFIRCEKENTQLPCNLMNSNEDINAICSSNSTSEFIVNNVNNILDKGDKYFNNDLSIFKKTLSDVVKSVSNCIDSVSNDSEKYRILNLDKSSETLTQLLSPVKSPPRKILSNLDENPNMNKEIRILQETLDDENNSALNAEKSSELSREVFFLEKNIVNPSQVNSERSKKQLNSSSLVTNISDDIIEEFDFSLPENTINEIESYLLVDLPNEEINMNDTDHMNSKDYGVDATSCIKPFEESFLVNNVDEQKLSLESEKQNFDSPLNEMTSVESTEISENEVVCFSLTNDRINPNEGSFSSLVISNITSCNGVDKNQSDVECHITVETLPSVPFDSSNPNNPVNCSNDCDNIQNIREEPSLNDLQIKISNLASISNDETSCDFKILSSEQSKEELQLNEMVTIKKEYPEPYEEEIPHSLDSPVPNEIQVSQAASSKNKSFSEQHRKKVAALNTYIQHIRKLQRKKLSKKKCPQTLSTLNNNSESEPSPYDFDESQDEMTSLENLRLNKFKKPKIKLSSTKKIVQKPALPCVVLFKDKNHFREKWKVKMRIRNEDCISKDANFNGRQETNVSHKRKRKNLDVCKNVRKKKLPNAISEEISSISSLKIKIGNMPTGSLTPSVKNVSFTDYCAPNGFKIVDSINVDSDYNECMPNSSITPTDISQSEDSLVQINSSSNYFSRETKNQSNCVAASNIDKLSSSTVPYSIISNDSRTSCCDQNEDVQGQANGTVKIFETYVAKSEEVKPIYEDIYSNYPIGETLSDSDDECSLSNFPLHKEELVNFLNGARNQKNPRTYALKVLSQNKVPGALRALVLQLYGYFKVCRNKGKKRRILRLIRVLDDRYARH